MAGCPEIDESEAKFLPKEYLIALVLYNEGKCVKALPITGPNRNPDALVGTTKGPDGKIANGVIVEFKSVRPGADSGRITNAISRSLAKKGQARRVIVDGRQTGLTYTEADRALRRVRGFQNARLEWLRIIGDGFDLLMNYP